MRWKCFQSELVMFLFKWGGQPKVVGITVFQDLLDMHVVKLALEIGLCAKEK